MTAKGKSLLKSVLIIILTLVFNLELLSQVENVPVSHPVYSFLELFEIKGFLPNFSTSNLPLQRKQITDVLIEIKNNYANLTQAEKKILHKYLVEFEIDQRENAVVFYSESDTIQVFSKEMFGDKEKFIYHLKDDVNNVNLSPLGSIEGLFSKKGNVILGNLGVRLFGSLGNHFGYYIKATNGSIFSGDRNLALQHIHKLQKNVKFSDLNSDFDFSESHVIFQYDWFYAGLGREDRLLGSGIGQRLFISENSPAMDAWTLGAKFKKFEYFYSHSSLLATNNSQIIAGFNSNFPDKYLVTHRFSIKPSWGEISFWEGLIYSKRGIDMAYLTPISFFKSLEHALRDRDNSMMGGDFTLRPLKSLQFKGSFILDDLKFGEIGTGYWSNKTAWNASLSYATAFNIDFGIQYTRVEPYTFSHFDSVNSYTNDKMLIGTNLLPNSDEVSINIRYWWGNRYPVVLKINYLRHGNNLYDENGILIKNVGGDPFQTNRGEPLDSSKVSFLAGDVTKILNYEFSAGYEIARGFNIKIQYILSPSFSGANNYGIISFAYEDF